jgi:hypothetical protein
MQDFLKMIRARTTAVEDKMAASSARETPKARLVYAGAIGCLIAFSVALYLGTWLRH